MGNLSYEDAKAKADEFVMKLEEVMGISGLEVDNWEYIGFYYENEEQDDNMDYIRDRPQKTGYELHYTRKIDEVPITYTDVSGGGLEDMESTIEPWYYERCDVIVSEDGLEVLNFSNPYKIGEVKTENVKLLDFDTILKNYEDMMLISNAEIGDYEKKRTYHISRIALGYIRIYDPSVDNLSGVLVPVWDFFGGADYESEDETEMESADNSTQSFMTINAVDGSIIDRELGY